MTTSPRLLVAQISAVHGVRGLIKLACFCDDPALIDGVELYTAETGDKTVTVHIHHFHKTHFLAEAEGITDRTAAEKLRGTKLYLPRANLPTIKDDKTFYHVDLIGLAVIDTNGNDCGRVLNVANFGAGDLIEVKPPTGSSYYLPFDDTHVPHVDIAAGKITVDQIEVWKDLK
jgi:16S rRNA processing protein RimM